MATFDDAISTVLNREGGFVDNPNDPGGITNFGITLKFLQSINPDATADDIRNMTVDQATEIYKDHYWRSIFEGITSQEVATKCFDMSVNMGNHQADKITQSAINDVSGAATVVVDGSAGPATIDALNAAISSAGEDAVLDAIRNEAWDFYQLLIQRRPELAEFENGWKNRAYA